MHRGAIDSARWAKAKPLFDEALALAPAAREGFLRRACAGDAELLDEIRSLLDWHRDDTEFLERPAGSLHDWHPAASDSAELVGTSIGVWRIVSLIGSGGMGVVYRAERGDDAFHRHAALKIVRAGASSPDFVERFRLERKTLAGLDHPNIARLLDGGATASDEPYFVMELVDGIPVNRFADEQRLSIAQRLELFLAICRGVQYAHANFVVHRDIKPDNVLVGRDGIPKLVDFGVAKISGTDADAGSAASQAEARTWLMTPDYASPEQLSGGRVTTASDVYSLGVLLYELLTGVRPYALQSRSPDALRRELDATAFLAPSLRVQLRAQSRRLAGDLDAIVARALARDPDDRYPTVEQLIDDLDRHQSHLPVRARGRGIAYVTRRYIRRHSVIAAAALSVAIVAMTGVWLVMRESAIARDARARAERRFDDVRELARTLIFDVHDALVSVPGTTAARAMMMRTAVQYLDRLDRESSGDRALQAELASAFVRVGDAQGHPNSPNVGDTAGARASYGRAIELSEVLRATGSTPDVSRTLAMAQRKLADVSAVTGDLQDALAYSKQSQQLFGAIAEGPNASVDDRLQAGIANIKLGDLLGNPNLPNLGRPDESLALYRTALTALQSLSTAAPDHLRVRRYLGLTFERLGTIHEQAKRWPDALEAYRASFDIRQALADTGSPAADARRDLAIAYEKLGNIERVTGLHDAALASYRSALSQFSRLAALDPADINAARTVAISREKLAIALAEQDGADEAAKLLAEALASHRAVASRNRENTQARCDVARVTERLGDVKASQAWSPADRCALWTESLSTRQGLRAEGRTACASEADISRLQSKTGSCR